MSHIKRPNGLLRFSLMSSACVLMAVSTQAAFAANRGINPKIYNGTTTNTQENPYMVALLRSNKADAFQAQFCGGTLIAKNWVLTAAHCVFDSAGKAQLPTAIDVLVNRSVLSATDGERIGVESIISHQFYNAKTGDNDIALIKLKTPANATPIELLSAFSEQDGAGNNSRVLGWGVTYEHFSPTYNSYYGDYVDDIRFTDSLQQAALPIVSNATCQRSVNYLGVKLTNNMMCAGFQNGSKDACHGDSGGPLVVFDTGSQTWRLAGITISGHPYCSGNGTYGVYTRVKNYKNLISDIICTAEEKPAAPVLQVSSNGAVFNFDWNLSDAETQYQLLYSPHGKEDWHSIEMRNQTHFSDALAVGSDYDVKVNANKGICESNGWSNVVRVTYM